MSAWHFVVIVFVIIKLSEILDLVVRGHRILGIYLNCSYISLIFSKIL